MAITVVQTLGGTLVATDPVSVDIGTTAVTSGNLMLFVVGMHTTSPTVTGITDTLGSTWTQKTTLLITGEAYWEFWTAPVPSTGLNDLTVDCSAAPAGGNGFMFLELSGVSAFDVGANNTNSYTAAADPVSLATLTTTRAGIIISSAHNDSNYNTTTATMGGGFTVTTKESRVMIGYRNSTGGESVSPTATFDGGGSETGESMTLALYTSDPLSGGNITVTGATLNTATIAGTGVVVLIDYVDKTSKLIEREGRRGLKFSLSLGGEWRASLSIYDRDSTSSAYRPDVDQSLQLWYYGQCIFNGTITTVRDRPLARTDAYVVTDITAKHGLMVTEQLEVNNSSFVAGQTLKQALVALRDQNNPGLWSFGVVTDPAMATGPTLEPVTFDMVLLGEAFNRLMERTGYIIRISPDYLLQAFDVGDKVCSYSLTDSNDLALDSVTWEKTRNRQRYVNRVNLRYNDGASTVTVEDSASITSVGLWERTFEMPEITDVDEATEQANGKLRVGIVTPKEIQVKTRSYPMPLPGDVITLSFANRTLANGSYLITRIEGEDYKDGGLEFTLTCVSGTEPKMAFRDLFLQAVRG